MLIVSFRVLGHKVLFKMARKFFLFIMRLQKLSYGILYYDTLSFTLYVKLGSWKAALNLIILCVTKNG